MNIIEQKRQVILNDSSTATSQRELLDVLENLLPTVDSIVFKEPLHGDIDFAVMEECGFNNVTSLVFEAGDVTSIRNLPKQITRIHIAQNLLTHLEDLPESLVDLNAAGNGLQRIDLSTLQNLKSVNVSNNELTEIILSPAIETLLCENNKLVELDLDGMELLKTLNCNGNPLLLIINFQDTISNFTMETNPALEIRRKMGQKEKTEAKTNVEIKQALNHFFELKSNYEEKRREMKTKFYERIKKKTKKMERREMLENMKIPCIYCGREVNTIFTIKDRVYKAKCGDEKNPCQLNIEINAGDFQQVTFIYKLSRTMVEEQREQIIKIKMDSLLNYKSEKSSVKEFKENIEEYNEYMKYFKDKEKDYEDVFFNKETAGKIERKNADIFESQEQMRKMLEDYKRTKTNIDAPGSQKTIEDIMNFYFILSEKYRNLDILKYPLREIKVSGPLEVPIFTVIQKSFESNRIECVFGDKDEPEVIAYNI